jgi:polyisoprenoid-binding protein YceI
MRSKLKLIALSIGVLFFTELSYSQSDSRALTVEANHSTIQFSVPIAKGITRITGKFTDYTMEINYNDLDFSRSTFSVTIQAKSIDTGIDGRDDHLRTSDFFDVSKFPEITFVSERIENAEDGYTIFGKFTMHGVTKEMKFPLKMTGKSGDNTIGFSARLTIDRMDYGVGADFKHSSMEDFLGEQIAVEIDFWTKKKKAN